MKQQSFYNAAIYCRLSKDDDLHGESSSISTQKQLLTRYVTENNWRVVDYYIDDGISGTTFERGGFKRMLGDIETGKITMVVTKDLSRLGRDYLKTGYYTEVYFPENDVRYIALNDGIDTIKSDNDIAPFKNILNEMYAKGISRKIKSAYKIKVARGDHQGAFPPFGYKKHPEIKGRILIDEVSSQTIKLIFDLAKQGYGANRIRNVLIEKKCLTPSAYLHKQNPQYFTRLFANADEYAYYAWTNGGVERIVDNEIYIGNMIHYKEVSVSFKSKKRQNQPRDKWVRIDNTHEPIIDRETWDLVQERYKHRGVLAKTNPPNIFARIVRCADCEAAMWLTPRQKNPKTGEKTERRYFQCATDREYGKIKCTTHNASFKAVYTLLLNDIRQYAILAVEEPDKLLSMLTDEENKQKQKEVLATEKEYKAGKNRIAELEILLQRLFEENVSGRLNDANYTSMFARYQTEQEQLIVRAQELEKKLSLMTESQDNSRKWVDLIAKYKDLQELDAPIINQLCEKILIHEPKNIDGKRTQKIEIFYRFIGNITQTGES